MNIMHRIKWPLLVGFAALVYWVSILPSYASGTMKNNSLLGTLPAAQIHGAADGVRLCEEAIAFAEQSMGIPRKLLHAIALGESGRGYLFKFSSET